MDYNFLERRIETYITMHFEESGCECFARILLPQQRDKLLFALTTVMKLRAL